MAKRKAPSNIEAYDHAEVHEKKVVIVDQADGEPAPGMVLAQLLPAIANEGWELAQVRLVLRRVSALTDEERAEALSDY